MKGVLAACRFLAVGGRFKQDEISPEQFAFAALYFPLVGLVFGLSLAILNRFFEPYLESELLAVVLITWMILMTRAVHLDGTLKTFETLALGTNSSQAAPPVGIYGLLAVLLVALLKIRAVEVIGDTRNLSLLLTPVFARWSLVIFLYGADAAAEDSLARLARTVKGWHLLITTAATLAFAVYLVGRTGLWVGLCLSLFALLSRGYLQRRRGGFSYDNLGAVIELSEALSFILFASL